MRVVSFVIAGLLTSCLLTACIEVIEQPTVNQRAIISEHVRAFNEGDAQAMSTLQHPDIEWLSVSDSSVSVEVSGRQALVNNMVEYFKSPTKVTGTLRNWGVSGPYVSVTETATWTTESGTEKSQSSMTVYQLEDNLIRRVWYYPAVDN